MTPSDLQCGEIVLYQQKNSPKAQRVHLHAPVLGKMFSGSCSALVFRQTSWCHSSLLVSSDHGTSSHTSSHTSSKSFTCSAARFLSPLKRNYHEIKEDLFLWQHIYTLPYHSWSHQSFLALVYISTDFRQSSKHWGQRVSEERHRGQFMLNKHWTGGWWTASPLRLYSFIRSESEMWKQKLGLFNFCFLVGTAACEAVFVWPGQTD